MRVPKPSLPISNNSLLWARNLGETDLAKTLKMKISLQLFATLIISILFFSVALAQDKADIASIKYTEGLTKDKGQPELVYRTKAGKLIMVLNSKNTLTFQEFDKNLKVLREVALNCCHKEGNDAVTIIGLFEVEGDVAVLTEYKRGRGKKRTIYCTRIDGESFQISVQPVKLVEFLLPKGASPLEIEELKTPSNKFRLFIGALNKTETGKEFKFVLLSENLKVVNKGQLNQEDIKYSTYRSVAVGEGNDLTIYIYEKYKKGKPAEIVHLWISDNYFSKTIKLHEEEEVKRSIVGFSADKGVYIVGFYKSHNKRKKDGVYKIEYGEDSWSKPEYFEFDDNFYKSYFPGWFEMDKNEMRQIKKLNLNELTCLELIVKNDKMILLSEQQYTTSSSSSNGVRTYHPYYGYVIRFTLNEDMKLENASSILKESGVAPTYYQYLEGSYYLLYWDHINNYSGDNTKLITKTFSRHSKTAKVLVFARMNNSGVVTRDKLTTMEDLGGFVNPSEVLHDKGLLWYAPTYGGSFYDQAYGTAKILGL
ncbi:MAG: hypothetical protein CL840_01815 [Crocinitomicaceae bacterium]|nr:hypothetical protein [Crocinitomicaceae bacterium]